MTGRLFLHIGPPKTATTSLQLAFESLEHPQYRYLGVFQPRERNQGSLAQQLHTEVNKGEDGPLYSSVEQIKLLVRSGGIVLLSEEMLSLAQNNITTADKIALLGRLFNEIPVTVLTTLRDPIDGLPSLYQELYQNLPFELAMSFSRFCSSDCSECFNYGYLATNLEDAGFSDVRWLDFQGVKAGTITTEDIFGTFDLWCCSPLATTKTNVGEKSGDGSSRILKPLTLKGLGRSPASRALIDTLGLSGTPFIKGLSAILDRISIRRNRKRKLVVPSTRAKELCDGYDRALCVACGKPLAKTAANRDSA